MSNERKSALYPPYTPHPSMRLDLQPVPEPTEEYGPGTDAIRERLEAAETDPPPELMCRRDGPGGVTEHQLRKDSPMFSGFVSYFPDAIMWAARLSVIAMKQHNLPALFWDYNKSNDHQDSALRHAVDFDEIDSDDVPHVIKEFWRAGAAAQTWLEKQDPELHARRQAQRDRAAKGER